MPCFKCPDLVSTYSSKYKSGGISYGGYADYSRVPSHFVIQLSDIDLPSHIIAPMLCGGVTTYSPLARNGCGTTAKKVGIIGVGGLGHFGVMWAKALGKVDHTKEYPIAYNAKDRLLTCGNEKEPSMSWAFSRKNDKREDVLKMGADQLHCNG